MKAYVSRVTANGADIEGDIAFSEQVALLIEGSNLSGAFVEVIRSGVVYTPLLKSQGQFYYLLVDNGVYVLTIDGVKFAKITVENIIVPEFLPASLGAFQTDKGMNNITAADKHNLSTIAGADCINYPYVVSDVWPSFCLEIYKGIGNQHTVNFQNCSSAGVGFTNTFVRILARVIDAAQPAYIEIDGFIIFVFNYQQQRRRRR